MSARTKGHAFLVLSCAAALAASLSATGAGCAGSTSEGSGGAGGSGTGSTGGDATGGFGGADGTGGSGMTATVSSSVVSSTASTTTTTGAGGSEFVCGNGILEGGEICDGSDFGGKTCKDYGLAGGFLQCNPFCQVVVSACTPPESCNNDQDDDEDGDTDCADSDCANVPTCVDSCAAPQLLSLPDYDYFVDTTGEPNVHKGSCTTGSGPEKIYKFTASDNVDIAISLTYAYADFSLSIRTDCGSAASELFCVDDGGYGDDENLSFKATKGQSYFLLVDGIDPTEYGYFDVEVQEVFPESFCTDNFDDDFDGLIDCADPDACQGTKDCKPGAGAAGTACMDHKECVANSNDPICIDEFYFGWPNGYCSEYCNLSANDCPSGSLCSDYLGLDKGLGVCLKTCTSAASCPAGMGNQKYKCADFGEGFVCIY